MSVAAVLLCALLHPMEYIQPTPHMVNQKGAIVFQIETFMLCDLITWHSHILTGNELEEPTTSDISELIKQCQSTICVVIWASKPLGSHYKFFFNLLARRFAHGFSWGHKHRFVTSRSFLCSNLFQTFPSQFTFQTHFLLLCFIFLEFEQAFLKKLRVNIREYLANI